MGVQRHLSHTFPVHSSSYRWFSLCNSQETISVYVLLPRIIVEETVFLRALSPALYVRALLPVGLFSVQDMLHVRAELQSQACHVRQLLRHAHLRHPYAVQLDRTGADRCAVVLRFPVHGILGKSTSNFIKDLPSGVDVKICNIVIDTRSMRPVFNCYIY